LVKSMQVKISKVDILSKQKLYPLLDESKAMGFRFIERLITEWESGANCFEKHGEAFFVAKDNERLIGICGLNADPYSENPHVGRVRHLYVLSKERRKGVGRMLVNSVIEQAQKYFTCLRLKASDESFHFYSALGFIVVYGDKNCTHLLNLKDK
jgi:GNAT superfamily N-acetyltransferase